MVNNDHFERLFILQHLIDGMLIIISVCCSIIKLLFKNVGLYCKPLLCILISVIFIVCLVSVVLVYSINTLSTIRLNRVLGDACLLRNNVELAMGKRKIHYFYNDLLMFNIAIHCAKCLSLVF